MSMKSEMTIRFWDDLKRLPTRFKEVSIHLRKLTQLFEEEMEQEFCDWEILHLYLPDREN